MLLLSEGLWWDKYLNKKKKGFSSFYLLTIRPRTRKSSNLNKQFEWPWDGNLSKAKKRWTGKPMFIYNHICDVWQRFQKIPTAVLVQPLQHKFYVFFIELLALLET